MLSRFKSEVGSAVSDFVILVVPATLLIFPLLDIFGLYQSSIVSHQINYEIARFAALADVSDKEASSYGAELDSRATISKAKTTFDCTVLSSSQMQKKVTFWPELISVPVIGWAECEL